jgi:SAM-dependent methyltransferase
MERIFDEGLVASRHRRARASAMPGAAFLMEWAVEDLADRLATVQRRFERAAAVLCHTDHAARALVASGKVGAVQRVEDDPSLLDASQDGQVATGGDLGLAPESFDLVVSLLALQEVNDVPGALVQMRRALRPDGLLLAAMAGTGTLAELRDSLLAAELELTGGVSPRVAPLADVREAGALLQRAGLALPVTDVETLTVRYATMFDLLRDLRAMGVTNAMRARSRRPATRALFRRAAEIYAERFADADGRIRATFAFIWMSGWAPHASQQQPLKPGSGAVSLADALAAGAWPPAGDDEANE